jgi:hypothetical protein
LGRRKADHKVRRFYGDPEGCWGQFKQVPRQARITPGMGRGADSAEAKANAPVAVMFRDGSVRPIR